MNANQFRKGRSIPALITHYSFGLAVLPRLGISGKWGAEEAAAFFLGNQGPDPFFYAIFACKRGELHEMGKFFQMYSIDASLDAFHKYLDEKAAISDEGHAVLDAYFCGYLCHFVLDRNAHPLVDALSSYGSADAHTHGQVESGLDVMMLYRLHQADLHEDVSGTFTLPSGAESIAPNHKSLKPGKRALGCSPQSLLAISAMYACVARQVYGRSISQKAFARSVKDMRILNALLYTRKHGKRLLIARLENLMLNSHFAALFKPQAKPDADCEFSNSQKQTWVHPHTGQASEESFDEIFLRSVDEATTTIASSLMRAEAVQLSKGLNFSGGQQNPSG